MRRRSKFLSCQSCAVVAMVAILFGATCAPGAVVAAAAPDATSVRLRIGVTADGLVRVTPDDLLIAGVDPSGVDPRTFSLSSLGSPVAVRVDGESDGRFEQGDSLIFFGQRFRGPEMDQKYTDERVYWLDIGGTPGPRIESIDGTPAGDLTPPADFPATIHAEQSVYWWTLYTLYLDTQDTWFWDRLVPVGTGASVSHAFPYVVPNPSGNGDAVLRVEEISRAYQTVSPDHRTTIAINGVSLLDQTWDGKQRRVFTTTFPGTLLHSGSNTVTVAAINPPGITADDVYVNYWELEYRRQFLAWDGQLDFIAEQAGAMEFATGGWSSSDVVIWDITDPQSPRELSGASSVQGGSTYDLRVRANDAMLGSRYWLQEVSRMSPPASLLLRPSTGLRAPASGADVVIVTATELRAAAENLAAWHRENGRRAILVEFSDVVDEFNDGIYHPKAVPAMLAWAQAHWPAPAPTYLTLVGDGNWNFKHYNPSSYPTEPILIPPYLAWVDPEQGEAPADALFGDIDGDGIPDLAIGRLAVNTPEEADRVVSRIASYDQTYRMQPWQTKALFVADNADSAGDFATLSDQIIATELPGDLQPIRAYLPGPFPTAEQIVTTRSAISASIQSGVFMVQYAGHGAPQRWANELIWSTSDASGLTNGSRLPVVMTFNCLDGYFAYPGLPSIAETMQRAPNGGAIASISPSGLGFTTDQYIFRKILMQAIFRDGITDLGRALLVAKQRFYAAYGFNYLIATMMLYGDPAMRLPAGLVHNYFAVSGVSFTSP